MNARNGKLWVSIEATIAYCSTTVHTQKRIEKGVSAAEERRRRSFAEKTQGEGRTLRLKGARAGEKRMTDRHAGEQWLRKGFKWLNRYMVLHWRLGLGPVANRADLTGCIMVLVHIGRKSARTRRTPVNYALIAGDLYCVAGFGRVADWYQNLLVNPAVEVWLPAGWYAGAADDVTELPAGEKAAIMRQVLINSGFAARIGGINAAHMTDDALLAATATYRLVRIRCTEARTGAGGPGDLAWVWPLATTVLTALLLLRRKR